MAGNKVTPELCFRHMLLVLKSCVVGLWQPPMRQGMLRALMPNSKLGTTTCILPECQ